MSAQLFIFFIVIPFGDQVQINFVPERPGDFGGKNVSASRAQDELGWKPAVNFEDGLKRTVDWFRAKWQK